MKIAFVACSGTKTEKAAAAKDLYISPLFKKTRAHVEAMCDEWHILSALHRVVHPNTVLEPYDFTLAQMSRKQREVWAADVMRQIRGLVQPGDRVYIFAGQLYREHLIEPLKQLQCYVDIPLEGLGIGEQLQTLSVTPDPDGVIWMGSAKGRQS